MPKSLMEARMINGLFGWPFTARVCNFYSGFESRQIVDPRQKQDHAWKNHWEEEQHEENPTPILLRTSRKERSEKGPSQPTHNECEAAIGKQESKFGEEPRGQHETQADARNGAKEGKQPKSFRAQILSSAIHETEIVATGTYRGVDFVRPLLYN